MRRRWFRAEPETQLATHRRGRQALISTADVRVSSKFNADRTPFASRVGRLRPLLLLLVAAITLGACAADQSITAP
jgi:hypothetical protein